MNVQRAIELLRTGGNMPDVPHTWKEVTAACAMAVEALERRIPKAVRHERMLVGDYRCPSCNAALIDGAGTTPFCGNCGQAIEWRRE